jgi:hypothetical protein
VISKEVRGNPTSEAVEMEKVPKELVFELRNEEHDSDESNESDEEVDQINPIVRRYEQVRKSI